MHHPTSLGIRPQYIAEYLEKIASVSKCPLDKILLICHGLYFNGTTSTLAWQTRVKASDMIDGINRRATPYPLRPHLNGWLQACADAWDKRKNSTAPGRSHALDGPDTMSQEWMKTGSAETTDETDIPKCTEETEEMEESGIPESADETEELEESGIQQRAGKTAAKYVFVDNDDDFESS
jgi:hypothetical protein